MLNAFNTICVQTQTDRERLENIADNIKDKIRVTGNIKFDQEPSAKAAFDFGTIFGSDSPHIVITAASTHAPEDALILEAFTEIRKKHPSARLVTVPRHAERGDDIERLIDNTKIPYLRRSNNSAKGGTPIILLADTTGELASFIKASDIIIMGKTLCGNNEGQSIIEPAIMGKPVISGYKLKNFRQALEALVKADGVKRIHDSELADALDELISSSELRSKLGNNARNAMLANKGALAATIDILNKEI